LDIDKHMQFETKVSPVESIMFAISSQTHLKESATASCSLWNLPSSLHSARFYQRRMIFNLKFYYKFNLAHTLNSCKILDEAALAALHVTKK
jgi:hypothetical protein